MPMMEGIYYKESAGSGEEPVLVWIHGAGGSGDQWPYSLRRLAGWRVLAPDLPGHGRSMGRGRQRVEAYVEDVIEWLSALGVGRAVVGGHSMGAAIGLEMALQAPDRVQALVLMGAGARMEVNPRLLGQLAIPEHLPATIEQVVNWSFARKVSASMRAKLRQQLASNAAGVLYGDFKACSDFDIEGGLASIRQPALVVCGAEDRMMPAFEGEKLAQELARGKAVTLEGRGHMMMVEGPKEGAAEVEGFLEDL